MKNFFKNLLGKVFPHGVIGDDNSIRDVYAGPDDMNNWKKKKKITGKVYAGPDYYKKKEMKCVYAGPEYFEKQRKSMEGVYAGPQEIEKRSPKASEMEDVYMGPPDDEEVFNCVYMGPPEDIEPEEVIEPEEIIDPEEIIETTDAEDPDKHISEHASTAMPDETDGIDPVDDPVNDPVNDTVNNPVKDPVNDPDINDIINDPQIAAVYAGPVSMNNEYRNQTPIGFVYAGPGYEKNKSDSIGMFFMAYAGPNPSSNAQLWQENMTRNGFDMKQFAEQAQNPNAQNGITGTDAANDLKVYKKCPACGTRCYETQKFCNECGTMLDGVEITDESKTE